jgi:hypothetical protein
MFEHIAQVKKDINELQPENPRILNLASPGLTCEIQLSFALPDEVRTICSMNIGYQQCRLAWA